MRRAIRDSAPPGLAPARQEGRVSDRDGAHCYAVTRNLIRPRNALISACAETSAGRSARTRSRPGVLRPDAVNEQLGRQPPRQLPNSGGEVTNAGKISCLD